jgi:hypothetical protein
MQSQNTFITKTYVFSRRHNGLASYIMVHVRISYYNTASLLPAAPIIHPWAFTSACTTGLELQALGAGVTITSTSGLAPTHIYNTYKCLSFEARRSVSPSPGYSSTVKRETIRPSETSADFYWIVLIFTVTSTSKPAIKFLRVITKGTPPPRRPGFGPRPGHVGCLVDEVAGAGLLRVLSISPANSHTAINHLIIHVI